MNPGPSLDALYSACVPLYVECRSCKRRAVLQDEQLPFLQGNMATIGSLRLRCRCGSYDVRRGIPFSDDARSRWLAGEVVGLKAES